MKRYLFAILFGSLATFATISAFQKPDADKIVEDQHFTKLLDDSAKTTSAETSRSNISPGHNYLQDSRQATVSPGQSIEEFSFRDIEGKLYSLSESTSKGSAVFVFMSTTCPLAKKYTQRLNRLAEEHKDKTSFFAVFPNGDETIQGIHRFANDTVKYPFPSLKDTSGFLTEKLGASITPQAIVIDSQGILRYHGAIDDNPYKHRVRENYLQDALHAVTNGEPISVATTKAMGCTIHREEPVGSGKVTYSGHVAQILNDNCMSCHREGQVAPFSLTNYDEAKRWRTEIREYTRARVMPPWKATKDHGEYKNDISLTDNEIQLIDEWVNQGAPLGNEDEIPPSPKFDDDWAYGKPDLVIEMPEEYVIGPEGDDDYRHFVIPYEAVQDKFINAVDVRPGNRNVVHHVLAYFDTSGKARELDAAAKGPGYSRFGDVGFQPTSILGGWAPGSQPIKTPFGSGHWLPKKGDIVLQVHYYRTGVEERDKTKIGFYFSKQPKTVPTRPAVLQNKDFVIPAKKAEVKIKAEYKLEEDNYIYSVTPHMHLLGKNVTVTAYPPEKEPVVLVKIDDWDFNWQATYHFKKLMLMPKGTVFRMEATYDNSAANPNNPYSPPRDVRYGEETTDEMCLTFIGMLRRSEYQPYFELKSAAAANKQPVAR